MNELPHFKKKQQNVSCVSVTTLKSTVTFVLHIWLLPLKKQLVAAVQRPGIVAPKSNPGYWEPSREQWAAFLQYLLWPSQELNPQPTSLRVDTLPPWWPRTSWYHTKYSCPLMPLLTQISELTNKYRTSSEKWCKGLSHHLPSSLCQ